MRAATRYNDLIAPLQILIYIPTLLVFLLLGRGTKQDTSRGVLLLLAAEWGTVGVLFFLVTLRPMHWGGSVGAAVFLAGAMYYAILATRSYPPHFRWRNDAASWLSLVILSFGIFGYPALSWIFGRTYPAVTSYGLMPGSVAFLTLGVAVSARPAPFLKILMPALIVAAVSPLTVWLWGLWEDVSLTLMGMLALGAWLQWRNKLTREVPKDTIRFDF